MKIRTAALVLCVISSGPACADGYRTITTASAGDPITLTGHDLTIEQLVAIARQGQPVEISPEVLDHQADAHALLLEAGAEGIAVAGFDAAANNAARTLAAFESGAVPQGTTEIPDEGLVRAAMAVRANTLAYQPVTAPIQQMLLDFLNDRITPVVAQTAQAQTAGTQSAGAQPITTVGPGPMSNIAAAMVGRGDVYYRGVRMPAAQALSRAGLMPVAPADFDDHAFMDTNAFDTARTALLAADGRQALEWSDLNYAMNLEGAGTGLAVLSLPAQADRPFAWLNWDSGRILAILRDSYLLDGKTTIDSGPYPAVFDLSATRQGAAWQAWGGLRNAVLVALNSSDQPLAVRPGLSPRESPELSSGSMAKYFVKGGKLNSGKRGFVVPTLNRDLYPLTQTVSAFVGALSDLSAAIMARSYGVPVAVPGDAASPDRALGLFLRLLAMDLSHAATVMDGLAARVPGIAFGEPASALLIDLRKAAPTGLAQGAAIDATVGFLMNHTPATYFPDGEPPPGSDDGIPLAHEKIHR